MNNRNIHGKAPGDNGIMAVHDHSGMQQQIDPNAGFAKGGLASKPDDSMGDNSPTQQWMNQLAARYGAWKDGTLVPTDNDITDWQTAGLDVKGAKEAVNSADVRGINHAYGSRPGETGGIMKSYVADKKLAKGGMMTKQADGAPIEVPPGALPEEVQDNIPAKLSPGEFTIPADETRYIGLKTLMQMRAMAKKGLMAMQQEGQIQEAPTDGNSMPAPVSGDVSMGKPGFATGGLMSDPNAQGPQLVQYTDPTTGRMGYHYVDASGKPIVGETVAAPQQNIPNVTIPTKANLDTGQVKSNGSGNGQGNAGGIDNTPGNPGNGQTNFQQSASQKLGLGALTNGEGAPINSPADVGSQMPSANGASVGKYIADHEGGAGGNIGGKSGDGREQQAGDFTKSNVAATPSLGVAMNMAGLVAGLGSPISTAVGLGVKALSGKFGDSFNTPGPTLSTDAQQRVRSAYMTGGMSMAQQQLDKERQLATGATGDIAGDTSSIDDDAGARNALAAEGNISRDGFSTSRTGSESLAGAAQDGPSSGGNDAGGDRADNGGGGIGSGNGPNGGGQGDRAGFAKGGLMMPKKKVLKLAKGGLAVPQDYDTVPQEDNLAPENNELGHYGAYLDAQKDMKLTPEEKNLYQHDLSNLATHQEVHNSDGSVSTILQRVVEHNGKYYNIPSVWDGKILPDEKSARTRSAKLGWDYWPSYKTPDEADARYMQMHEYLGREAQN